MSGSHQDGRHPITGLPTGRPVEERVQAAVNEEDGCVMYVGLDHLEAFEEGTGLFGPATVLRFMAILLVDTVDEIGQPQDLVGHLGWGEFVVVTARECADRLRDRLRRRFADEVIGFYDPVDWSRGYTEFHSADGATWRVPILSLNFTLYP